MTSAVDHRSFAPSRRCTEQLELWDAQRAALARELGVYDFQIVQSAFSNVRNYDDVLQLAGSEAHEKAPETGPAPTQR